MANVFCPSVNPGSIALKYVDFAVEIENGDNLDIADDVAVNVNPGHFVKRTKRNTEKVVGHPVRRRIIMWLMLMGNAARKSRTSEGRASFEPR